MKLFITEKPSVAQEYKKVLKIQQEGKTDGYVEGFSPVMNSTVVITWAVGHLIAISSPEVQNKDWGGYWRNDNLPMIPKAFKYEANTATYKQFKIVESLYHRNDIEELYYAGDSGREGIYIQALIRNQIFKTAPKFKEKVVWIDSFTEDAILKGIREAKDYTYYQNMIDSGYARAIYDWLVGLNFTRAISVNDGRGKTINTGRVITPTLAMVVYRQKEIDAFTKTFFYGVKTEDAITWKAVEGTRFFDSPLLYNENGFKKEVDAKTLCEELNHDKKLVVKEVKTQTKTEYAPYLFNLADLQDVCAKMFKISPDKTLEIAQELYEKKFTTYPRTDSRFLSTAVAKELKQHGMNIPARYVDDNKVTDHYAIIPTYHGNPSSLSGLESSVYQIIVKRFEDTMLPPFIYSAVSIVYSHKNGELFFESFRIVKQKGFRENAKLEDVVDKAIPTKGTVIVVPKFELRNMETKPPVPFTTGTLILAMEKAGKLIEEEKLREQIKTCGIGTSATRASIIKKLEEKNFIVVDKNQKVAPTDFGKTVIAVVEKIDEMLVSPVKTAEMEMKLGAIASGEMKQELFLDEVVQYVETTTKQIITKNGTSTDAQQTLRMTASREHKCPCCKKQLRYGQYGWYCTCGFNFSNIVCGHAMTEEDLEDVIENGKTAEYTFQWKSGKSSKSRLVLNKTKCKMEFEFSNDTSSAPDKKSTKTSTSGWGTQSKPKQKPSSTSKPQKSTTTGSWGKPSTSGWGKKIN